MTDFETWLLDVGYDRLFRVWIYYPEKNYRNEEWYYAFIKEAIELPNKDILLGLHFISDAEDFNDDNPKIEYYKLNQLQLAYFPEDINEENWE